MYVIKGTATTLSTVAYSHLDPSNHAGSRGMGQREGNDSDTLASAQYDEAKSKKAGQARPRFYAREGP